MQKNHIVTTRKDGVRLMVKVKDPKVFNILDMVSKILKDRFKEEKKLFLKFDFTNEPWVGFIPQ